MLCLIPFLINFLFTLLRFKKVNCTFTISRTYFANVPFFGIALQTINPNSIKGFSVFLPTFASLQTPI